MKTVILLLPVLFLLGCLETRSSIEQNKEKNAIKQQMKSLQQSTASQSAQVEEINNEFRKLYGQIETLDNRVSRLDQGASTDNKMIKEKIESMDARMKILQEALTKMDQTLGGLTQQMNSITTKVNQLGKSKAAKKKVNKKVPKGNFTGGEFHFSNKNWKDAILKFEKYRKLNPKGRRYAEATYKIGVSFQELGMSSDAKVFYEEVSTRFPKTNFGKKAKSRLKKIK